MTAAMILGGLLLGLVVGGVSGMIGIGGGVLIIPALLYLFGMSQLKAQGTSLAILLLPVSFFAFWRYYKAGHVDLKLALMIAIGFCVGGWVTANWAQHVRDMTLRRAFAVMLVFLAIKLFFTR
jgi:uncharacterized membrane protein YfcA